MKFLPLLLLTVLLSCTKSQESSSTADSTSVDNNGGGGEVPEPAPLTAEETERVRIELFVWIRDNVGARTTLTEDFKIDGNKFQYTLLRHNGSDAGMQQQEYSGNRPMNEDESAEWQADSTNAGKEEPYVEYSEINYYFTSEIDTFYVKGEFVPFFRGAPESSPKKIFVLVNGVVTHKNANYVHYGEPVFNVQISELGNSEDYPDNEFEIDFAEPLTFGRDQLYVKAKIADLTDADLAGFSKEELSFVRNDIFAHHGHTFKTPKMIKHYEQLDWYEDVIDDAVPYLNSFEKRNVDFLKKKEG